MDSILKTQIITSSPLTKLFQSLDPVALPVGYLFEVSEVVGSFLSLSLNVFKSAELLKIEKLW